MLTYGCHRHHLHWLGVNHPTKASCEMSAQSLEDFLSKGKKCKKRMNYVEKCLMPLNIIFSKTLFWFSNMYIWSTSCPNQKSFRSLHCYWHDVKSQKQGSGPYYTVWARIFPDMRYPQVLTLLSLLPIWNIKQSPRYLNTDYHLTKEGPWTRGSKMAILAPAL